jgi:hypothetical protein
MRLGAFAWVLLSSLHLGASSLSAQAVLGLGDDALTLPKGVIRIRAITSVTNFSERYGKNTPGRADGSREPLGVDFNLDTVGLTQFPNLAPVQAGLRSLTGITDFNLSLGRTIVSAQARVQTTPIVFEAGLTNRLSLGILVPFVSARNEISFNANPKGTEGNVSFNPVRTSTTTSTAAIATNSALVGQLTAARTQLEGFLATCTANPGASTGCPAVLANGPALLAGTAAFASGVSQIYGTSATTGSPFVPVAGSRADSAIRNRVTALRTAYQQIGITAIPATTTGPTGATATVTPDGAQRILTDSAFGIAAAPLRTVTRQSIGDIEVGLKFRLFDSFGVANDTARFLPNGVNLRQSVAGVFRFGTGTLERADNFVDLSTGNGQNDVEIRSQTDILYGRHLFTSVVARYVLQLPDQQLFRITDQPDRALAPLYRQRTVDRNLGDQIEFEITPRWVINEYFSLGAQYFYRNKAEDQFTGTFTASPAETGLATPLTLDASTLNQETSASEQRIGLGFVFSSVTSFARGKAKFPVEIQYFNSRTVTGAGGAVAKLSIHQVQVRVYGRLFGGKR